MLRLILVEGQSIIVWGPFSFPEGLEGLCEILGVPTFSPTRSRHVEFDTNFLFVGDVMNSSNNLWV